MSDSRRNQRDTDPSELAPSIPPGTTLVADEVLQYLLEEVKSLRADVRQSKVDILARLADLTLEVIPRIQKIEAQAITGFPICRYHHQNGASHAPEGVEIE